MKFPPSPSVLFLILAILGLALPALASADGVDDASPGHFEDADRLVRQAIGIGADHPPIPRLRKAMLKQAAQILAAIPHKHLYQPHLAKAAVDIQTARVALNHGDPKHVVKDTLYDANDELEQIF